MATNTVIEERSKVISERKTTSRRQRATSQRRSIDRSNSSVSPLIYLIRLAIFGFGLSTIIGTTISIVKPPKQPNPVKIEEKAKVKARASSRINVIIAGPIS